MIQRAPYHVVDTSGWLEYLTEAPNAGLFADAIEDEEHLIVPTMVMVEVFRWILRERGEADALRVAGLLRLSRVVDLDDALALEAARLGNLHKLPLADSVIFATAHVHGAMLWTQDAHFEGLPNVEYHPKPKPPAGS